MLPFTIILLPLPIIIILMDQLNTLFCFDFDHTIIDKNSDTEVFSLFPGGELPSHLKAEKNGWTAFMDSVLLDLSQTQQPSSILSFISELQLNHHFAELLQIIKPYQKIIVSDANQHFVEAVLTANGLDNQFDSIITNRSEIREGAIRVSPYHQHDCPRCPVNLCKQTAIREYLNKQTRIIYVGDGGNDFCPLLMLNH